MKLSRHELAPWNNAVYFSFGVRRMLGNEFVLLAIAIIIPIALAVVLVRVLGVSPQRRYPGSSSLGLSFDDLIDFAFAENDRTEALEAFFEWKHKVLLELLKAVAASVLANLALVIKFAVAPDNAALEKLKPYAYPDVQSLVLVGFAATVLVGVWLLFRLRRIPLEYSAAVRFIDLVR